MLQEPQINTCKTTKAKHQWYPAYTNTCLHCCRANEVSEQWAVAYDSWQPKRTEQTLLSIVDKVDAILPVYLPYIPIETLNFQVVGLMPWKYSWNNLYTYTLGVHVGQRKVYGLSCTTRFTGSAKTAKVFRPSLQSFSWPLVSSSGPNLQTVISLASTWQ